jgi:2,4-dienoyl-CoA reductase-like NADH-dependent reductase (Old Yellow Enzyme family)
MPVKLFEPLSLREVTFRNRIFVSPMCQYSAVEGVAQTWHLVHAGSFAKGGAGLVLLEATGVSSEGRITPDCLGLWNSMQANALKPVVQFAKEMGSAIGIQLAHAGRKASTSNIWKGGKTVPLADGGWVPFGPSAIPYNSNLPTPLEMGKSDLNKCKNDFTLSAELANSAGFDVIELHMAHGYLLHSFLSPLSNFRKDEFGGSFENRIRFPLDVVKSVREVWPQTKPLLRGRSKLLEWIWWIVLRVARTPTQKSRLGPAIKFHLLKK